MWGQYSSGWGCVSMLIRHEPSGCLKTWKTVDCLSKCWGFWRKTQLLAVNCADILSRFERQRCTFFHPAADVKFGSFKVISVDSQQPQGARWSSLRQQTMWFTCPCEQAALLQCKRNHISHRWISAQTRILQWVTQRQDSVPYFNHVRSSYCLIQNTGGLIDVPVEEHVTHRNGSPWSLIFINLKTIHNRKKKTIFLASGQAGSCNFEKWSLSSPPTPPQ